MSYSSTVYRILIASPSDVAEEREITTRLIQNWNDVNSFSKKIVLLPLKWETHSSPTYEVRPQEAINRQLVDSADLVIGLFWAKIGSDSGLEISGTIEEIKRAANNGKDVMIYFSKRGIDPSEIDIEQLKALNEFKKEVLQNALIESFNSIVDFRDKLNRHLEYKIRQLDKKSNERINKLDVSFMNHNTNEFDKTSLLIERDYIDLNEKKNKELILENSGELHNFIEDGDFDNLFERFAKKINSIPVVIGVKNLDTIIHNDLNVDMQLKTNVIDSLLVKLVGTKDDQNIDRRSLNGIVNYEDEKKIFSLFNDTLEKVDPNTLNINTESLSILPNKIKCVKPVILIYPKKNVTIQFNLKIISNSLLEPVEKKLNLKIKVNKRNIKPEEIAEVIKDWEDSVPF